MSSGHWWSQHHCICCIAKSCYNYPHQWGDEAHVEFKSLFNDLLISWVQMVASTTDLCCMCLHCKDQGMHQDRTGQNLSKIRLNQCLETLSRLWITCIRLGGYFTRAKRGGLFLSSTRQKFITHCEFSFICISYTKEEAEHWEDKKFGSPKLPGSPIFTPCERVEPFCFGGSHVSEETPRAISKMSTCFEKQYLSLH